MKKFCTRCLEEKDIKKFAIKHKATESKKEKIHAHCKSCKNKSGKQHYQANKKYYNDKRRISNKKRSKRYTEYKKTLSCKKCEMSFKRQPFLCDFHHRDKGTKKVDPSRLRYCSWDRLMEEVAKCDALCSNCHRKEHNPVFVPDLGNLYINIMAQS